MKKKYILMIIALFIASLNLRPSINSIAPLLETIRTSLGMNASVASLLTSIPVLCMGLFAPVAVKFSGKWGIERVLGWSLLVIGVGTVLRFFTQSTSFLLITAFIAGIGIAFAGPLLSGFIKRHFPKHVPSMIAIYTVALTLGAALSSSLIVPMQNSMNSWQSALGIWGYSHSSQCCYGGCSLCGILNRKIISLQPARRRKCHGQIRKRGFLH